MNTALVSRRDFYQKHLKIILLTQNVWILLLLYFEHNFTVFFAKNAALVSRGDFFQQH